MTAYGGIWNFDGRQPDRRHMLDLSERLKPWGPDGEEIFESDALAMVSLPFRTVGDSTDKYSLFRTSQGVAIAWDGRLDNRNELLRKIPQSSEQCDASIVALLYLTMDTRCFSALRGDWTCCIWDPGKREIFLARDCMGIRHLYYRMTSQSLLWCSHLAPLVEFSGVTFKLEPEYIAGYLARFPDAAQTPYRNVWAVPPGSFIRVTPLNMIIQTYFELCRVRKIQYDRDNDYEVHFRQLFEQAVARRIRAGSTVMAELSGGLDSSSIVCMSDQIISSGKLHAPQLDTLSFFDDEEFGCDERPYISVIEQLRGRKGHHFRSPQYSDISYFGHEHFVAVPGYSLHKINVERNRVTALLASSSRVLLSGIGGDELLGGIVDPVPQLADLLASLQFRRLKTEMLIWSRSLQRPVLNLLFATCLRLLPRPFQLRLRRDLMAAPWIDPEFSRRFGVYLRQHDPLNFGHSHGFSSSYVDGLSTVEDLRRQMAFTQPPLVGCYEKRYPYLDQDLVEFLLSIPPQQLFRPGERRSLMRRALRGIVPDEVLWRRSKSVRSKRWLMSIQRNWTQLETLFSQPLVSMLGLVNRRGLIDALEQARSGTLANLVGILRVISLEQWLRDLVDRRVISLGSQEQDRNFVLLPALGP